jgi:hypothetical protein
MEFVAEKTMITVCLFIDSANDGCRALQKEWSTSFAVVCRD